MRRRIHCSGQDITRSDPGRVFTTSIRRQFFPGNSSLDVSKVVSWKFGAKEASSFPGISLLPDFSGFRVEVWPGVRGPGK